MKPSCAIAVFVKTPGLTPLKTRLAKTIGTQKAEQFYLKSIEITENMLQDCMMQTPSLKVFWAVSEPEGVNSLLWSNFSTITQNPGSLGERIHSIYSQLKSEFDYVFIMGADSPTLTSKTICESINKLKEDKVPFVLGRTKDGGFYLFGSSQEISKELWTSIPYSCESTSDHFCKALQSRGEIWELHELFDIDTYEDLMQLAKMNKDFQNYL